MLQNVWRQVFYILMLNLYFNLNIYDNILHQ
jgi:hypothetical protein